MPFLTHHEGAHHLVVLVHAVVAVHHVLAQVRPKARPHDDLAKVCANVQRLCVIQQSKSRVVSLAAGREADRQLVSLLAGFRRCQSVSSPRTSLGTLLSSCGHGCQPLSLMARQKKSCRSQHCQCCACAHTATKKLETVQRLSRTAVLCLDRHYTPRLHGLLVSMVACHMKHHLCNLHD
jgi:hypothetical protein